MTTSQWLNTGAALRPGAELFRSDRTFQLWAYSASHSQLLLRSDPDVTRRAGAAGTTIDVLFKPVEVLRVRRSYDGLLIRCATVQEADGIRAALPGTGFRDGDHVFLLESGGETDHVVAMAVGWHAEVRPGRGG